MITYLSKVRGLENLRIRRMEASSKAKTLTIELVYPSGIDKALLEQAARLCEDYFSLPINWQLTIVASRSNPSQPAVLEVIDEVLQKHPSAAIFLQDGGVKISGNEVALECDERLYVYFSGISFDELLTEELNSCFCESFTVTLKQINKVDVAELADRLSAALELPTEGEDRLIQVYNVERFIGEPFSNKAMYIKDIGYESEVIISGMVGGYKELVAKKTGKQFFAFRLTDPTGSIEVLYFPTKDSLKKIQRVQNGDTLLIAGRSKSETDGKVTRFKVMAHSIHYCKLPESFKEVEYKKELPKHYRTVFPQKYVSPTVQISFSDMLSPRQKEPPAYLQGKTFVIFDIETTGTDSRYDRITEIGAIKMVNGVATETFSTLIDPEIPIPAETVRLNGIDNAMVAGKPKIEEVIGDFFKFAHETILVAHNAPFDTGFVFRYGEENGYYFKNEVVDTLPMARRLLPRLRYHNMAALAEHFAVVNQSAHRALCDCEALLDIFTELAKLQKNA